MENKLFYSIDSRPCIFVDERGNIIGPKSIITLSDTFDLECQDKYYPDGKIEKVDAQEYDIIFVRKLSTILPLERVNDFMIRHYEAYKGIKEEFLTHVELILKAYPKVAEGGWSLDYRPKEKAYYQREIALKWIEEKREILNTPKNTLETSSKPKISSGDFPKIKWNGTQKELAELFIQLNEKEWIEPIQPGNLHQISIAIISLFQVQQKTPDSNSAESFYKIMQPSKDENGKPSVYDKIFTPRYQPKFNGIKIRE